MSQFVYVKKSNIRVLVGVFVCVVFLFLFMYLKSYTYANEENVYYFDDLKIGDYIPYNSYVVLSKDYHFCSGMDLTSYVRVSYLPMNGISYQAVYETYTSSFSVSNYETVFGENEDGSAFMTGWMVASVVSSKDSRDSVVYLKPVNVYSEITTVPSSVNEYSVSASCFDQSNAIYSWYRANSINKYSSQSSDGMEVPININGNVIKIGGFSDKKIGYTATVSFTFEANKGDILSFDTRGAFNMYYDYAPTNRGMIDLITIQIDGKEESLYPTNLFTNHSYTLSSSGEHTLTIVLNKRYEGSYTNDSGSYYPQDLFLYIKDLKVMTLVNQGDRLDTKKINNGDTLYYMSTCDDGYVMGKSMLYTNAASNQIEDNKNPNTKNGLLVSIVVFFISIILLTSLHYFYRKRVVK